MQHGVRWKRGGGGVHVGGGGPRGWGWGGGGDHVGGGGGGACRTWQQRPDQFNQCFTIHTILILSAPDGDSSPTALSPLHPAPHTATRVGDSGHNLYHNPFLYTPPPYSHQTARLGTCTVLIKRTDSENKLHQQKLWMEEKSIFCQRIPPPTPSSSSLRLWHTA